MAELLEHPTFFFTWAVLCIVILIIGVVISALSKHFFSGEARSRVILIALSSLSILLLVEAVLRITKYTENYSEARNDHYNFICHGSYQDTLHVWPANDTHEIGNRVDFVYSRRTNSLGLSDREWQKNKPDSIFRIVALGDSFTEGDGAPADSSWPKLLEQQLLQEGKAVEVFNAGVCGSDPFQSLMLLKYRLLDYRPDLVIVTIAMQDLLEDIAIKGGMERFNPKLGRRLKLFELVYAYSHIARLIYNRVLGYSWVLIRESSPEFMKKMTKKHIPELFEEFARETPDADLVFVLYPHQLQTEQGYQKRLEEALYKNAKANNIKILDLRSCYQNYIDASGRPTNRFWWKNDGHHNSDGYVMMAHCIGQKLGL